MIYKTQSYLILGKPLVMESDNKNVETGTVTVNDIAYHVIRDEQGQVTVNRKPIEDHYFYFNFNVEAHIATSQGMTAWQKTQYNTDIFEAIKESATTYGVGFLSLFVYRADDGTCWRYDTGDDPRFRQFSRWFPSEIKPSADHFKAWVISSIEIQTQ
jgi:hypothetical protein